MLSSTDSGDSTTTATVLFRLDGPMQAWSRQQRTHGKEGYRPTQTHPTKTGVIGLVANALGLDRADPVDHLTSLRYAVRVDRPGTPQVDYHTAGGGDFPLTAADITFHPSVGVRNAANALPEGTAPTTANVGAEYAAPKGVKANGTAPPRSRALVLSRDHYLADACFIVALTGPVHTVEKVRDALSHPARLLHLGRAAYPTTGTLNTNVCHGRDPVDALADEPRGPRSNPGPLTVHAEGIPGTVVQDQPISYGPRTTTVRLEGVATVNPEPGATTADSSTSPQGNDTP